ncbi:serine hydrolase [Mucilaginibacter myungsuensis]|uniref:Serine hydrolase n=1 Tax=Mucilaginibacter myungsuensis TaxID=649104 RepID=A0A929L1V0_9SPHI|nr:serine hydrolase [Mucilaginibacter myungsuensis]MBE9664073.1 serine hydrolase [Mucilaginibacter myungsuensis]MDN3601251.1 serine hydrolase [Mucilaginibacter myungsuensis]
MKKFVTIYVMLMLVAFGTLAQVADRSNFIRDSLDVYMNRALTNWRIPGAAVCVVKDGQVVVMKTYGVKELGLPGKVDENTLFMIGSNTKAFTATAMAMLQENKLLSLDDKVTKHMPYFKLDNKFAGEEATIRDLLCHRLGFNTFQGDFTFYNTNLSRNDVISKMGLIKADYAFRTKWGYTNSAFLTAGEIIPRVTQQPWEAYVKAAIFAPLGMTNTLALSADLPKSLNRTVPHTLVDGRLVTIPYCQIDAMAPCGSISSSINDMSKWVMALLNDGKVGPRQIIPTAAIQATRQPQDIVGSVRHLNGETNFQLYGLGWFIQDYANHRIVMHDGGVNGYVSSVTLVPQDKLGIIILTNTDQNSLYEALRWEIMDAYFKQPYRNYSEVYLKRFKSGQAEDALADKKLRDTIALKRQPTFPLSAYTGSYDNTLYGKMTITIGGDRDQLQLRFEHHPKMFATAQPLGGNRFYVNFSDPVLGKAIFPFTVANNKVTGITVKVADFVEMNTYDFRKVN